MLKLDEFETKCEWYSVFPEIEAPTNLTVYKLSHESVKDMKQWVVKK